MTLAHEPNPYRRQEQGELYGPQKTLTSLEFATEQEACEAFDRLCPTGEFFRIYNEVPGWYDQPRSGCKTSGCRADRLLIPQKGIFAAGWEQGVIVVEAKASDKPVAKAIAQAADYLRAYFDIGHGIWIKPQWGFIWPLENPYGDIDSLMAQSRVGWCTTSNYERIVFACGGTKGIVVKSDGTVTGKKLPMGYKQGNRS